MSWKSPRRILRRSRRGVDVNVATVLLVAITVVLAAVLFVLAEGYLGSTNTHPSLGASLALSSPVFAQGLTSAIAPCSAASCNFYNMTVQSATSGLQLHDLVFELISGNGTIFVPTGGLDALNASGTVVGQYAFSSESWVSGGTVAGQSHLTFALYTSGPTPRILSGDTLRVIGVAAYSGSISIHLP
jgi:hypothetical protein